jgi:hypothetical protein
MGCTQVDTNNVFRVAQDEPPEMEQSNGQR